MHYYKFNIADWALHTSHLNLIEEAVYFRLINFYYDSEKPIPLDTKPLIRRLRLSDNTEQFNDILLEFFEQTENGFIHKRCDEILKEYRKTTKKNRANGAKGGRPRKDAASQATDKKPSGLIVETQQEPNHIPNQELITINHKPITINQSNKDLSNSFDDDANSIFDYWCSVMQTGRSSFSPKRKKVILDRLKEGYTKNDIETAITNCSNTPHNMGQNSNGKKYNDIELICRSPEKLESFRDNPGALNNQFSEKTQSNIGAFKQFLGNEGNHHE